MKIEEVQQLKKQLKADYEADSAAIERVLKLLGANNSSFGQTEIAIGTVEEKSLAAIAQLPNQFILADVIAKLSELYPSETINRATVSSVIFRLKEENKIKLERAGIGRRAAIYGKP
jgi:hypothetical protein